MIPRCVCHAFVNPYTEVGLSGCASVTGFSSGRIYPYSAAEPIRIIFESCLRLSEAIQRTRAFLTFTVYDSSKLLLNVEAR